MKITIYTIPDCQFCKQEKDYLTSKGIPFDEKDVMANKDFLAEMLQKSANFAGVPFTTMEEGSKNIILKGFTQSEFDDAIASMSGESASVPPAAEPISPSVQPMADVPVSAPASSIPTGDVAPSMTSSPAPVDMPKPAMPRMDMPSAMPTTPVQPVNSSTPSPSVQPLNPTLSPSSSALDDPQDELNSLLEDLQTKVDMSPVAPAPVAPSPVSSMPAMPSSPSMPTMPILDQATQPVSPAPTTAPSVPDFSAGK